MQLARGAAPGRPPRQPSAAAAGSSAEAGSGLHSRGSKTERQRAQEITPAEEEDEDDLLLQRPRKAKPEPRWGEVYTWRVTRSVRPMNNGTPVSEAALPLWPAGPVVVPMLCQACRLTFPVRRMQIAAREMI